MTLRLAFSILLLFTSVAHAWPVRIKDAYGTTIIPAAPKRVLVVGLHEQDFLYALGIAPVGVHEWFGGQPYATWPWAEARRRALNATPSVQRGADIDLEWVWHLHPDLIIATYASMDSDEYAKLSRIAPVVGPPDGYPVWGAPWQAEMRLIAAATGRGQQGDAVIAQVNDMMQTLRSHYPQLAGRSASAVYVEQTRLTGYAPQDPTSRFLTSLGLVIPQSFGALGGGAGQFTVSAEQIALFNQDVSLWMADPETETMWRRQTLYRSAPMAKAGHIIWATQDDVAALSFQTPLSIMWVAQRIVPRLARALAPEAVTILKP